MILESFLMLHGVLLYTLCVFLTPASCRTTGAATATIPFSPLFTKPPTIVYTFDSHTAEEIIASEGIEEGQPDPGPRVSWNYWPEYADTDAILDPNALRRTDIGWMFAGRNLSLPDPSGEYNGCEGSIGKICAQNLVDLLQADTARFSFGLPDVVDQYLYFAAPDAANLSCPWDIFEEFFVYSSSQREATVAMENVEDTYLVPGKNASHPMGGDTLWNSTAKPELNKIIVTVMARSPISQTTRKDANNTQIEIMCMRAVVVDPLRDQPTSTPTPTPSGTSAVPSIKPNAAPGLVADPGLGRILFLGVLGTLFLFVW